MNRLRQSHRFAALFTLVSLLFMHMALAGYDCPGESLDRTRTTQQATSPGAASPQPRGCDGMDMEQPALCYAHGQVGNQSLDKPMLPLVPPFTEASHRVIPVVVDTTPPLAAPADSNFLSRTVTPPIAVRNCCLRI